VPPVSGSLVGVGRARKIRLSAWAAGALLGLAAGCGRTPLLPSSSEDAGTLVLVGDLPELARVGEAYQGALAAVHASGACEWLAQGSVPPGLALLPDGASARLAGTPEQSGDFKLDIQVRDAAGREAERSLAVHVRPRAWLAVKVVKGDGSGETRLLDSDDPDAAFVVTVPPIVGSWAWSWAPAGDCFAFASGPSSRSQVYLVDLRGTSPAPAVPVGTPKAIDRIDFVLGGRALLYQTSSEMFMARLAAGAPGPAVELIAAPAGPGFMGSELSPNGDWLMVRGRLRSEAIELLAIDLDVEPPSAPVPIHPPLVSGGNVSAWSFSPDGRWAMYEADAEEDDRFELFAVDVHAHGFGAPVKLNLPLPPGGDVGSAVPGEELDWAWPVWSPDGKKVAFAADAKQDGELALYVAQVGKPPGVSKVNQPFAADRKLGDFAWADGTRLLYWSEPRSAGADQLMLVETAASPGAVRIVAAPAEGTIARVVPDPRGRGVLYANGQSFYWMDWYWQDWQGSTPRRLYGPIEWSWGLYQPRFSADGAGLLFTTDSGGGSPGTTGAELYWSPVGSGVADPVLVEGRQAGGIRCGTSADTCQQFWRNDGRKLAYLTADGNLHLLDAGDFPPSRARVIAPPPGGAITNFSWPP
jgi:Tol biopolymer transport system component